MKPRWTCGESGSAGGDDADGRVMVWMGRWSRIDSLCQWCMRQGER